MNLSTTKIERTSAVFKEQSTLTTEDCHNGYHYRSTEIRERITDVTHGNADHHLRPARVSPEYVNAGQRRNARYYLQGNPERLGRDHGTFAGIGKRKPLVVNETTKGREVEKRKSKQNIALTSPVLKINKKIKPLELRDF